MIAAEYVLGVLPVEERQVAGGRIETDVSFARLVDRWETHFTPMSSAYQAVEAPASVKAGIDRRLFASGRISNAPSRTPVPAGLWSSLAFWRGLTAAALAALAIYIAMPFFDRSAGQPQARLVASLAADGSAVRYLVVYDASQGDVSLSHVAGERAAGRDFELWMIEGKNAPVSMGVIPAGTAVHVNVGEDARGKLAAGAILAVSVEPTGGSPTGQPTGPVVAAGDLRDI